jgi:hypothetical protein
MSILSAKKALKRSLKTIDERRHPVDYNLHQALLFLTVGLQSMDEKLSRLEAAAGTTPQPGATPETAEEAETAEREE